MKQLRIAILGCGRIALSTHVPILAGMSDVTLTAMAEPDLGLRQKALALAPRAQIFSDWREVVARDDVDAVVVCLPSALHAEAAIAAFRAGKHVYLEKPIACDMQGAARVLEAWNTSGRTGMTGFNYRFHPLAIELRRQLQSGRIGKVIGVQSVFCTNAGDLPGWKAHRSTGGGVLLDLASHHIDLFRFLLQSEMHEVLARVLKISSEADTATLDLSDDRGVRIHSLVSLRSLEQNTIELFGTDGKLSLDFYRSTRVEYSGIHGAHPVGQITENLGAVFRRAKQVVAAKLNPDNNRLSWRAALAEFVASSSEERSLSCDLKDGAASLAVIDAAEQSAASKVPVLLAPDCSESVTSDLTSAATNILDPNAPAMSVILATPNAATTIAATLRSLRAQTICEQLELVLVVDSQARLGLEAWAISGFHSFQIVEAGNFRSVAHADAEGVRVARAPIVAFAEDHAFPEPQWAAALIDAHRGPWAAVGPLLINANPDTAMSRADLLLGYGPWLDPSLCGERSHLPGHNSSYKRQALLDYGADLERMLEAETLIQWDMRRRGLRLFQTSEARVRHTNFSLLRPFANASFCNGRSFSAARATHWNLGRRLCFSFASPLIPIVRLYKIARDARGSSALRATLVRALPALTLGLFFDGLGQMIGHTFGAGHSRERLKKVEFDRASHITAKDRESLFDSAQKHFPMEVR